LVFRRKVQGLLYITALMFVMTVTGFTNGGGMFISEDEKISIEQYHAKQHLGVILLTSSYDAESLFPKREQYEVVKKYSPAAKINVDTIPARDYAFNLLGDTEQFNCLESLWNRESGWNHLAVNRSSGAYGIPQAYPAEKLAAAGEDWRTNPETQIRWGLSYIDGRYGSPCNAWDAFKNKGWY
jgi:hypothetical protein